jgi:hypothetical protein
MVYSQASGLSRTNAAYAEHSRNFDREMGRKPAANLLEGAGNLHLGFCRWNAALASCRGFQPLDSVPRLTRETRRSKGSLPQHVSSPRNTRQISERNLQPDRSRSVGSVRLEPDERVPRTLPDGALRMVPPCRRRPRRIADIVLN